MSQSSKILQHEDRNRCSYLTALMTVFSADGRSSADMSQWHPFSSKPSSTPTLASPVAQWKFQKSHQHLKNKESVRKERLFESHHQMKRIEGKWKSNKQEKGKPINNNIHFHTFFIEKKRESRESTQNNIWEQPQREKNATFANEYKLTKYSAAQINTNWNWSIVLLLKYISKHNFNSFRVHIVHGTLVLMTWISSLKKYFCLSKKTNYFPENFIKVSIINQWNLFQCKI